MAPLEIAAILDWSLSLPTRSPLTPSIGDISGVLDRLAQLPIGIVAHVRCERQSCITPSISWGDLGSSAAGKMTEIDKVRMIQLLVEQHPRAEHAIADFKRLHGVEGVGTHTAAVASGQLHRTWPVFRSTTIGCRPYDSSATSSSPSAMPIISWWRSWSRGRF